MAMLPAENGAPSHATSGFGTVESWNEWDQLREVWVGTLENKQLDLATEPATARKRKCYSKYNWPLRNWSNTAACYAEAKLQLENYIKVLKGEGIVVQRPTPFKNDEPLKTPLWSVDKMGGFTCPRDLFFVAGKQVIEAPMSWRSRYFENLGWRDLLMHYYRSDPGMRWSACPKPTLLDDSYGVSEEERTIRNTEFLFDAADCRRFGKDIFFHTAHTSNDLGRDWTRRELSASGIRVQDFNFEFPHFTHLDARITPVDENLCFYTTADCPTKDMLSLFKWNEWDMIPVDAREDCRSPEDQCAPGIHLNMLTIAPRVCIVEENEKKLIKVLRDEGVDVIPIPFSACYCFGGSLNCFTLDILRHGPAMKSYFPTLDRKAEQDALKAEANMNALKRKLDEGVVTRERPAKVRVSPERV